jgi:predicted metal-dependent phosphoesterase TrpH
MTDLVDFHVHSNRSCDGDFSPAELVGFARDKGFRAISIADHDTVAAYPEALDAGRAEGVEVIPSIEVTTLYGGREFHLLLPFVDWRSPAVAAVIEEQTKRRVAEARERVEKVRGLGFSITLEEVREKANGAPPLGVKIAQILLDNPENRGNPVLEFFYREENRPYAPYMFYKEFFTEGKHAFVAKTFVGLLEVLDGAAAAGGVPVLSHPGAYFQQTTRDDLRVLKRHGLAGLEVYTSYHTPEQVAFYRAAAGEFDLVPTAGSDFHGRIKPHVAFGELREGRYWMVERLRERRRKGEGA